VHITKKLLKCRAALKKIEGTLLFTKCFMVIKKRNKSNSCRKHGYTKKVQQINAPEIYGYTHKEIQSFEGIVILELIQR
jgi:hypothetical protein